MPSRWETRQRRLVERQRARGCVGRDERFRQRARAEAGSYLEDAAAREDFLREPRPMREAIEAYERRYQLGNRSTYDYLRDVWYGTGTTASNLSPYAANSWQTNNFYPTTGSYPYRITGSANYSYYGPPSVEPIRVTRFVSEFAMENAAMGPDALIRAVIETLIATIEREAGRTVSPDEVWYRWTTEYRWTSEEWREIRVEAEWAPPNTYPGPRAEAVWLEWQTMPHTRRVFDSRRNCYVEQTPEESRRVATRESRERLVMRTRSHVRALRQRVARRRARDLMRDCLTPEQFAEYQSEGYFHVETAGGTRRYRIRQGRAGNIDLVKDGEDEACTGGALRRYCFHESHPTERPPVEDNMLAQALFITAHEDEFLREANLA